MMLSLRRKDYIFDCYNSISEMYNDLKDKKRRDGADDSSESGASYFTGTNSLNEAYELMLHGDKELYGRIKAGIRKIDINKILGNVIKKNSMFNDIVGFQVNVPNYLTGIPTDMVNIRPTKKSQKILNIMVNTTVSAMIEPEEIEKAGGYYYVLIDLLEKSGYRCNVYMMNNFSSSDEGYMIVKCKNDREPFNKEKMAFILAHPSFQRRVGFKWMECCNCKGEPTNDGYGRPITNNDKIKSVVDKELKADFMVWSLQQDYKVDLEEIIERLKENGIKIGEE